MRISPFGLLRVASLPIEPLLGLAPPVTAQRVDAAVAELAAMEVLRAPLEDALFAVVPLVEPRLRSIVLEVRRSVHNRRRPDVQREDLALVLGALPEGERTRLTRWIAHQGDCAANLSAAEASYAGEVGSHVRVGLRALTDDEAFLRPLALASQSTFAQLTRDRGPSDKGLEATKLERSLLLYVARAAAKTSPFSVFMHHALVDITSTADAPPRLDPDDRASRAYLNRHLLFLLHRDAVACATHSSRCWTLNPSIRWGDDGGIDALVAEYVTFSDRLLRVGRPARFRLHPTITERLTGLPLRFSFSNLRQVLLEAGLAPDAADRFATQLQERGLVQPTPAASAFDARPEEACLSALRSCGGSGPAAARATLTHLIGDSGAFAVASSHERAGILKECRSGVQRASSAVGAGYDGAPPILWEDGFFRRPVGPIGAGIYGLLNELASSLRTQAVVTVPYQALRAYFVEEFGEGGVCGDLPAFLSRATTVLAQRRWWLADPATVEPPAHPQARVAVTVAVQFSAPSEAALAAGRATIVLNQAYPGCGWLSARHAFGEGESQQRLRRQLMVWLASIDSPAEPVDIVLSGDCNSLQAHPQLTRRVLHWPLEPCGRDRDTTVAVSAVSLRHDLGSDLLQVHDDAGNRLAPMYLGTTVPHPHWGSEFWLTTLSFPHRIARPMLELTPPPNSDAELLAIARRTIDRVVLSRASWWMRSDRMRRLWYRRRGAGRLFDVAADCSALGLPRRLYVRTVRSGGPGRSRDRKPVWVDTRNPFCLDVLSRLVARTEWIFITEAFPDRPVWPMLGDTPHTSELLAEMVM